MATTCLDTAWCILIGCCTSNILKKTLLIKDISVRDNSFCLVYIH